MTGRLWWGRDHSVDYSTGMGSSLAVECFEAGAQSAWVVHGTVQYSKFHTNSQDIWILSFDR